MHGVLACLEMFIELCLVSTVCRAAAMPHDALRVHGSAGPAAQLRHLPRSASALATGLHAFNEPSAMPRSLLKIGG